MSVQTSEELVKRRKEEIRQRSNILLTSCKRTCRKLESIDGVELD